MASVPGSILSTPTSSSPSSPTLTASFVFNDAPDVVTCTSNTISWNYVGSNETFTMYAMSSVSPHTDATGRRDVAQLQIAAGLDSAAQQWIWQTVNISSGWWILQAIGTDFAVSSSQFFIDTGTDSSCLPTFFRPTSSTTDTSTTGTSTPTTIAMRSGLPSTTVMNVPTDQLPVSAKPGSTHIGLVVGCTLGGFVVLVIAIIGYANFRRRKSNSPPPFGGTVTRPNLLATRFNEKEASSRAEGAAGVSQYSSWASTPQHTHGHGQPEALSVHDIGETTNTRPTRAVFITAIRTRMRFTLPYIAHTRGACSPPLLPSDVSSEADLRDGTLHYSALSVEWAGSSDRGSPVPSSATSHMYPVCGGGQEEARSACECEQEH